MFAFEATSILLVVAVLATVILARRPFKIETGRPASDATPGPIGDEEVSSR